MSMIYGKDVTSYEVFGTHDEFAWQSQSLHYTSEIQSHLESQKVARGCNKDQKQVIINSDRPKGAQ